MKVLSTFRRSNIVLYTIAILSCNEDEKTVPQVDAELRTYADAFVEEARLRGKTISLDNLELVFEPLGDVCGRSFRSPLRIVIYKNCWITLPDVAKEIIMFHELGHNLLEREHESSKLPNGDYASIMYNDPVTLYNEYTIPKRTYYLDELFGVVSGLPQWAMEKTIESVILSDEILVSGPWKYVVSGPANHEGAIVDSVFASRENSLAIRSNGVATGSSYWAYTFTPTNIEEGSALVLKVKIKAVDLNGGGAYFVLRGDVDEKEYPILFYTIQDRPVLGNTFFGESEYAIKVNYFPSKLDHLSIFLMLDGTSNGAVYFDDIQLLKYR